MSKKQGAILIVDDNEGVLDALRILLRPYFEQIVTLSSTVSLPEQLHTTIFQVVLLDMNFKAGINSGSEGLFWLHRIKEEQPALPVVLFTAYADIALAVRGIKEGATDFVVKPWNNQKLIETLITAANSNCRYSSAALSTVDAAKAPSMYWGKSSAMQALQHLVKKVAITDANILITGENGTGKELLARAVHELSIHRQKPMITVDMGAITETLFESELFGHVKGAFTDAYTNRTGKFVQANDSTLFLDEIGNLPYQLQAKLLTVLQSRSVTPVGGNTPTSIRVRLITATNCPIQEMVAKGTFREDLFYRINTIHLHIPALRERPEDIIPLANQFIVKFSQHYGRPIPTLSEAAAHLIQTQPWPGNIRELEHAIEKAVIICEGSELLPELFPHSATPNQPKAEATPISTLEEMEIQLIRQAIIQCEGNLSTVAAQLGITRQTLYNKMKRYGL